MPLLAFRSNAGTRVGRRGARRRFLPYMHLSSPIHRDVRGQNAQEGRGREVTLTQSMVSPTKTTTTKFRLTCTDEMYSCSTPPFLKVAFFLASLISTGQVLYDTNDNLQSVELTSFTRRGLAQDENDTAVFRSRRLEFNDCDVCGEAWNALRAGAREVCGLVDYGSPFSANAAASVEATCDNFGKNLSADRACRDQCPEGLCH